MSNLASFLLAPATIIDRRPGYTEHSYTPSYPLSNRMGAGFGPYRYNGNGMGVGVIRSTSMLGDGFGIPNQGSNGRSSDYV